MFAKLGQRSTSWWICVTITGIFATILVTVVAYPAYAKLCLEICTEQNCGPGQTSCSSCNSGLNGGPFTLEAQVNSFTIWPSSSSDNCLSRVSTFHSVEATNLSVEDRTIEYTYSSLIKWEGGTGGAVDCLAKYPSIDLGQSEGSFRLTPGETRSHSGSQTVTWTLAEQGTDCWYKGMAVTEVAFKNFGNTDAKCPAPKTALPNCGTD